jgi:2-polyprenyl-3-methyl-5-hydroxy-6-metoxy-1,4-benzoquinol methylase
MELISRNEKIIEYSKNKTVLHLGCVGFADLDSSERVKYLPQTLHYKLHKVTKEIVGLDYSKEVINSIKNIEGFDNIHYADVEQLNDLDLSKKFDLIVAGDIIEHLSNPGKMLDGLKRFCSNNTKIIITTPNSFGVASFLRFLFNKFKEGNEHVMTFNMYNMSNLLIRHEYSVKSMDTCYQEHAKKIKLFKAFKNILSLFPKFGGTLFVVAELNNK